MGIVKAKFKVANPNALDRSQVLELIVDTGALYSILPETALQAIGIEPLEEQDFTLADGRRIHRKIGQAEFFINGHHRTSPVIFGAPEDGTLAGVVTLETLGLEVDPAKGEIRPTTLWLL